MIVTTSMISIMKN